jgi:hypothetical protein
MWVHSLAGGWTDASGIRHAFRSVRSYADISCAAPFCYCSITWVHRQGDLRVAEDVHDDPGGHALHEQERRARVPQAVELKARESRRVELRFRLSIEPTAVERLAVSLREHEVVILPERGCGESLLSLDLSMRGEDGDDGGRELDCAAAPLGLRLDNSPALAETFQREPDTEHAAIEIKIHPAQPEEFPSLNPQLTATTISGRSGCSAGAVRNVRA